MPDYATAMPREYPAEDGPARERMTLGQQVMETQARIATLGKDIAELNERLQQQSERLKWLENEVGR